MNKTKLIIVLVGLLDVMWIGFVIPTLPDLVKLYWVSDHLISYWITVYAFCAFMAWPLLWQLSDIYGRKKILLICVIGSFLSSIVIAATPIYLFFLLGRMINGITGWNISILQAIISDISKTPQERKVNMWLIWSIFWIWFIIGPLMWWILLRYWALAPYRWMVVLSFIEILVIHYFYTETNEHMIAKTIKYNPFGRIFKYLKKPEINLYIISMLIIMCSFWVYQWVLPLFMHKVYHFSWEQSWYLMAGLGLTMVFNQVFLLKNFWLKKFSLNQLLYIINIWLVVFFWLIAITKDLNLFLMLFFFLVSIQTLVAPVYNWEIIEHTDVHSRWEVMWVLSSVQSLSMFIWPLIWGYLLAVNLSIFDFSAILIFVSLILVVKIVSSQKNDTINL